MQDVIYNKINVLNELPIKTSPTVAMSRLILSQNHLSLIRAMSQPTRSLQSVLVKIDRFAKDSDQEKLRFLASAVLPYGTVEKVQGVPELYRCLLKHESVSNNAVELLQRMLSKAAFKSKDVSLLDEHVAKPRADFQQFPDMQFHELLISVADELGNGEYLRKLLYVIPEEKIGVAPDSIKSAVHLFQRLLHQRTISADNHSDLEEWLQDIGRPEMLTAVQKQGLPHFDECNTTLQCITGFSAI